MPQRRDAELPRESIDAARTARQCGVVFNLPAGAVDTSIVSFTLNATEAAAIAIDATTATSTTNSASMDITVAAVVPLPRCLPAGQLLIWSAGQQRPSTTVDAKAKSMSIGGACHLSWWKNGTFRRRLCSSTRRASWYAAFTTNV